MAFEDQPVGDGTYQYTFQYVNQAQRRDLQDALIEHARQVEEEAQRRLSEELARQEAARAPEPLTMETIDRAGRFLRDLPADQQENARRYYTGQIVEDRLTIDDLNRTASEYHRQQPYYLMMGRQALNIAYRPNDYSYWEEAGLQDGRIFYSGVTWTEQEKEILGAIRQLRDVQSEVKNNLKGSGQIDRFSKEAMNRKQFIKLLINRLLDTPPHAYRDTFAVIVTEQGRRTWDDVVTLLRNPKRCPVPPDEIRWDEYRRTITFKGRRNLCIYEPESQKLYGLRPQILGVDGDGIYTRPIDSTTDVVYWEGDMVAERITGWVFSQSLDGVVEQKLRSVDDIVTEFGVKAYRDQNGITYYSKSKYNPHLEVFTTEKEAQQALERYIKQQIKEKTQQVTKPWADKLKRLRQTYLRMIGGSTHA